jgi:hemoglobin/transferrin/lactoferrin receptor protein
MANQNQGKADVIGFSSSLKVAIIKTISFNGTFNYTKGTVDNDNGEFPLDHIPPIYGIAGFNYRQKTFSLDFYLLYNGNKALEDYSPSGEDNLQYAPSNGMPSWETYNFKGSLSVIKNMTIYSGIENILDIQYRTFASGINAAGRNFYIGGKYSF